MKNHFGTIRSNAAGRKKYYIYFLVFACILTTLYIASPFLSSMGLRMTNGHTDSLNNDQTLVQPFTLKKPAESLSFTIATFLQRIRRGHLTVEISDANTGEQKIERVYGVKDLTDNHKLEIDEAIEPGKYLISFDFDGLDPDRDIVIYTVTPPRKFCSINDEVRSYEVNLDIKYRVDMVKDFSLLYLQYVGAILAAMAVSLVLSAKRLLREKNTSSRVVILRHVLAFACLVAVAIVLYLPFRTMLETGDTDYLRDSMERFYFVVGLLTVFLFLMAKDSPWTCWLLMAAIGLVWILTDLQYSIIDEGAHTEIIKYILNNKLRFPTVTENYEAVQGPVYYYTAALLTGWLPESIIYIGNRVFGLILLLLFGWFTHKTLDAVKSAQWYRGSDTLMNLLWLLFVINPNVMIRLTRVSNEGMMCVFSAIVVYLTVKMFIQGYDSKTILLATVCCALAFLTKATSAVLVFLIFMVCVYYKKWKDLFLQAGAYLVIVIPWFISNYVQYGALTGMKGHLDFVLPIVNPNLVPPAVRKNIMNYFNSYFLNPECGAWFDYSYYNSFLTTLSMLLLIVSVVAGVQHMAACLRSRLQFTYASEERKKTVFLSFALLPMLSLAMHAVQSMTTLNNTLTVNRYAFMMNGIFCAMLLFALSEIKEQNKRILSWITASFFAYLMVAMIGGYTSTVMTAAFSLL